MHKYLSFQIEAVENLKMGRYERDTNNEYTYSYIPGSAVKGAIVWKVLDRFGKIDKNFLNGDTVFYNAYPVLNDSTTIPIMRCYGAEKSRIRSNDKKIKLQNMFTTADETILPYSKYEFGVSENDNVYAYSPKTVENLHINKKKDKKGKMFRYEAISKGQAFKGCIRADEKYIEDLRDILSGEIIYLGGSKGSGYGRCNISGITVSEKYVVYKSDIDIENDLYIYFLSDAILYYNGRCRTYIPEDELKNIFGINGSCSLSKAFSGIDNAASYNYLYNTNTVCYKAVVKGSIIQYRVEEKINPEKIDEIVKKGVGLRREDGYGQIAILKNIPDKLNIITNSKDSREKDANRMDAKDTMDTLEMAEDDKKLILSILENIFNKRTDLKIEKLIIEINENASGSYDKLSTQIGKLMNIFSNSNSFDETSFKQFLQKYLDNIKNKKGKKVFKGLSNYKLADIKDINVKISIFDLLMDFVNEKNDFIMEKIQNSIIKKVRIGKYVYPSDSQYKELVHKIKVKFLSYLFKYMVNMKGGE